jgi:hypothetical protein
MQFIVAIHLSNGRVIAAVCDSGIHGKKFEENGIVLDLSSSFFKGQEKSSADTAAIMEKAYMINAAGIESVNLAIKLGLAEAKDVKKIAAIPHLQVLKLAVN